MEVMDSPLNRAHHYGRKADQLVAKEKYEEAILYHINAAELLKEALSLTHSEQIKLSLELQRDRHIRQQRLIKVSSKWAKLNGKSLMNSSKHTSSLSTQRFLASTKMPSQTVIQHEGQRPPLGWKTAKDDKTRLEEQSTAIAGLWRLVAVLLVENERLLEEHEKLKAEDACLRRDLYEEHQNPEAPQDQPAKMPPDLQEEIQLLWETSKDC
ncbi:nuclear receptor binding factor 2a [Myxocyprinus asiaticus]|uniref:nuclear receptor binding factor 2a n=1 Tax=Myxocyprinus asiaticus TaxID=70543 RepID=UPI0022213EB2|nr:nuclear receptor binding factor 2a [Myxocyprinus asiaticus]